MTHTNTSIIGAASGWGAQKRATEHGPDALQYFDLSQKLAQEFYLSHWQETIYPLDRFANDKSPKNADCLPYVLDMCQKIYTSVNNILENGSRPCVIGGDHSVAIGTWSALANVYKNQDIGLIWFDAHMDAHTPLTSQSHAYHGMPVACLLGYGEPSLVNLGFKKAKIKPENVVLLGIRSYEEGEKNLLQKLGVKIFYMDQIREMGFENVLKQAISIVEKNTAAFGISIDLDGFDPEEAPGVGSPEPNGMQAIEVLASLHLLKKDPKFKAFEITEYNPHRDLNKQTAHLIHHIMRKLLDRES